MAGERNGTTFFTKRARSTFGGSMMTHLNVKGCISDYEISSMGKKTASKYGGRSKSTVRGGGADIEVSSEKNPPEQKVAEV